MDVVLPQEEIDTRLAQWQPPKHENVSGYLKQYYELVQPIEQGAVLGYRSFRNKK